MTITTKFNVLSLNCYSQQNGTENIIFKANWTFSATDGTYHTSLPDSTELVAFAGAPFIPFADLTEDQVIAWIKTTLGETIVANYEALLVKMIDEQVNPVITTPVLPWIPLSSPSIQPEPITPIGL